MADDDEALFDSAMTDASEPQAQETGQPRDEHGRFAPKSVQEPEPQPESEPAPVAQQEQQQPQQQPQEQGIPSWRLKEEAERRREAEARLAQMQQRLAELERQTKQPEKVPDLYENPDAFVDHRARQYIDPLDARQRQLTEYYSRKDAIRAYGQEKVTAAYNALDQELRSGNPEALMIFEKAKQSLDPFDDIVQWYQKQTVFSQIGSDPNAWFEKQLEERLAKDAAFQAKLIERIRGNVQQQPRPVVTQLPPSLNKATSSAPPSDEDDDNSEAGLLRTALRR
jgi:hypothetical protein